MVSLLYNLPSIYQALLIVGVTVFSAFAGYAIVRRLRWLTVDAEQRSLSLTMVSIITTINSLLVAFAAISVWGNYNDADQAVAAEANSTSELARDLAAFDTPAAGVAARDLRTYVLQVIHTEWPSMQQRQLADPDTEACFNSFFASVNRLEPATLRQVVLLQEILKRANEMVKFRQQRLQKLVVSMPLTLWAVILIVSATSFVLLYVLPPQPFYVFLLGSWASTLGLAFFFIVAVDHPFAGEFSVTPDALQQALDKLVQGEPRAGDPHTWCRNVAAVSGFSVRDHRKVIIMTIKIKKATYDVPGKDRFDVTDRVQLMVQGANRSVVVTNKTMGCDPAFGQLKQLRVWYEGSDKQERIVEGSEGSTVILDDAQPAFPGVPQWPV